MNVLRVVIADDHALFREGLRQLLDSVDDVSVLAEASNGRHAVTLVAQHLPDVVLMDISMPEMDGIQATEMIVVRQPETQVVILRMYADDEYITHAIRAGLAQARPLGRGRARHQAGRRQRHCWLQKWSRRSCVSSSAWCMANLPSSAATSPRERKLLTLLAHGLSNQEIGAALHLTEHTVKYQFGPLYAKLGVHDRTQAVLTAMAMDLAPRPKPPPRTDW